MSDYGIQFADWCEFPPETMVGETVFDCEGNAIGWIVNVTVERSCASCPEMDNPDSYISHLQSALKWHDEHVPRPTNPRNTCVVLEGEKPPEEVMFVADGGGVTHYLPEATCHTVAMDCFGNPPFNQSGLNGNNTACGCSECGAPWSTTGLFRGNQLKHNFKACPICGARVSD